MLAVHRFSVAEDTAETFLERARAAVAALASRPGYRQGWVGRDPDVATEWVLATEWDGIGAYRRALSSYEAKVAAHPLLGEALAGPAAFEVLHATGPGGMPTDRPSGRAPDAATVNPGGRLPGR